MPGLQASSIDGVHRPVSLRPGMGSVAASVCCRSALMAKLETPQPLSVLADSDRGCRRTTQ